MMHRVISLRFALGRCVLRLCCVGSLGVALGCWVLRWVVSL